MNFVNNNTIVIGFLGVIAIIGIIYGQENVVVGCISGLAGFIAGEALTEKK